MASEYSQILQEYLQRHAEFDETRALVLDALVNTGIQQKRVLDLGCGPGPYLESIHDLGAGKITAVDINADAIRKAKEIADKIPTIELFVASGDEMSFLERRKCG